MEKVCDGQESESAVVFEVVGEPAVVINGVPSLSSQCMVPVHVDAVSGIEANADPCFGEWLEGRKVQKMFGGRLYCGKVVKYDSEANWYRIVYEDGDFEDLWWHELEEVLLPLDISVTLETLALQRFKCERSVPESRYVSQRNTRSRGIRSMEGTPGLLEAPPAQTSNMCTQIICHSQLSASSSRKRPSKIRATPPCKERKTKGQDVHNG